MTNLDLTKTVSIRIRRDTSSNWSSKNPILKVGEPGLETDTRKLKFGDGTTQWNNLPYSGIDINDSNLLENIDDRVASLIKEGSNIDVSYNDNTNELTISAVGLQLAGNYATIVNGKVPASELPSYVDDVLEFNNLASFPSSGEGDKIYVAKDSNKTYRWSGSAYVEISASPGSTDSVTEGSINKYYTDARASAAAPVQSVSGKIGVVTLSPSDIGAASAAHTHDRLTNNNKEVILGEDGRLSLPDNLVIDNSIISNMVVNSIGESSLSNGSQIEVALAKTVISNETINSLDGDVTLSSGSKIEVAAAKAVIANTVTNNLTGAGGSELSAGSLVEVGDGKVVMAHQTVNSLDSSSSLTGRSQIEVNSSGVLIGNKVTNTLDGNSISSFNGWTFEAGDSNLTLPRGGTLSETNNTVSLSPPTAQPGQSLVIRPTAAIWAISSSNYIEYGNPITIVVTLQTWAYFGTVNYTISGPGVTSQSLGRALTGKLTFVSTTEPDAESITWTIPANSNISEFTLTLTSVDGTLSDGSPEQTDPALYYDFEENAMPTGQYITVTNNGISSSEHSHVHLVAGDPSTVDIYLGDDDQYVKIEKDGGDVVIGTDSNTYHWTFGEDGSTTFPNGVYIDEYYGSQFPRIVADSGKAFSVQGQGSTGSAALAWMESASTSSQYAAVGVSKGGGDNRANVVITAGASTPTLKVWRFDENGSMTLPNGTNINTPSGQPRSDAIAITNATELLIETNSEINPNLWTFGIDGSTILPENTLKGYSFTATNNVTNYIPQAAAFLYTDNPILRLILTIGGAWYIKGPGLVGWKQITAAQDNSGVALILRIGSGSTPLPDGSEFPSGGGNVYTISQYVEFDLKVADKTWTFNKDGNLTLPTSGDILDSNGTSILNSKAPLASPTFTGTVGGITKSMVGLGNVDNTSDANKPVSTATQTALDLKINSTEVDTDLAGGPGISLLYDNSNDLLSIYANNENYITAFSGFRSGSTPINYDATTSSIQTLTLSGTAVTFTKGTGWPTSSNVSVDTILRITVTSATSITWTIVNDWFNQPPAGALSIGTHLFLLRAIGSSIIEGHYIGNKTN